MAVIERALSAVAVPNGQRTSLATTRLWLGQQDRTVDADDFSIDTLPQRELGFPGFRNSAGFKKVLERLGVPVYWRKHGYPPQCRPLGTNDYVCD